MDSNINMANEREERFLSSSSSDNEECIFTYYQPSISDEIHVGIYNRDCASQTDITEILEFKKVSNVLSVLVSSISDLKKSLHYAKLTLQAEYSNQLQNIVAELHNDVSKKFLDLQSKHQEHISVVRRSFKTQLANAIAKLSKDYLTYNTQGRVLDCHNISNSINEIQEIKKEVIVNSEIEIDSNLDNLDDMAKLFTLKLKEAVKQQEYNSLKKYAKDLELKIADLEVVLENTNNENMSLTSESISCACSLEEEKNKVTKLLTELSVLQNENLKDQQLSEEKLIEQALKFKTEMEYQIRVACELVRNEINNSVLQKSEIEHVSLSKESEKHLNTIQDSYKLVPIVLSKFHNKKHFERIMNEQQLEITKLEKELAQNKKMWSLKIKILQQQIHALKDEMFLRTTLQRKTIKMRHVTVSLKTTSKSKSVATGENFIEMIDNESRKYRLPAIIQPPS